MTAALPARYYLAHFHALIDWLDVRYHDLLRPDDLRFIAAFRAAPADAQALLVRCVIRRQEPLRWRSLHYAEITDSNAALAHLIQQGWIDADPLLSVDELLRLATKAELIAAPWASQWPKSSRKSALADWLRAQAFTAQRWSDWLPDSDDRVIYFTDHARMDRFRLLFFGNRYQDWSEFVITDLGHQRYEQVALDVHSRAFHHERDVAAAHWLHDIGIRLHEASALEPLFQELREPPLDVPDFLASRRQKRLFQLGAMAERQQDWALADAIYAICQYPGSCYRAIRVCEKRGDAARAHALATTALSDAPPYPVRDDERQALTRALPRLAKSCGLPAPPKPTPLRLHEHALHLPCAPTRCIELSVCEALRSDTLELHYVENTLFSGLFGLLFWEVIFAPVAGAFFNPYQRGPADLYHPEFASRRAPLIARCLAQLDNDAYKTIVLETWQAKYGLQNPFVVWPALHEALLTQALAVIPAQHLRLIFQRMLSDLRQHCSGLPDLIAFDSADELKHYRLIEVKGPNDRLQDNQRRWFAFFAAHGIEAQVLHVSY